MKRETIINILISGAALIAPLIGTAIGVALVALVSRMAA